MAKKIVRPIEGIDVDSATNRRNDNTIYMAKNLRPTSSEDLSLGEYANIKGLNRLFTNLVSTVVKVHKISNNIILFVNSSPDYIALIKEEDLPLYADSKLTFNKTDYYWNGTTSPLQYNKIMSGDFGFASDKEISIQSYYESENVQKIYFAVEDQPIRALNIIYDAIDNDIESLTVDDIEIVPPVDLAEVTLVETISGNLLTGKVFYTYKVLNDIGVESKLAPISKGYHITKSSELANNDYDYKGYGIDVDSGKGIKLTISDIPTNFNFIKVYCIHYINDTSLPIIKLIYDGSIIESLTINDIGVPIMEFTAEEFALENSALLMDGKLEIKNNRMYIANYSEEAFDIDDYATGDYWDARVFRYKTASPSAKVYEIDDSYYTIDTSGNWTYSGGGSGTDWLLPETADCINKSNDLNVWDDSTITNNYIYQLNGSTYGGSGKNITISQSEYGNLICDKNEDSNYIKWYAERRGFYNTYDSHASPHYASASKTFKLEETYRLGIQFKDSRNRLSYVKWMCDYKFVYKDTYTPFQLSSSQLQINLYSLNIAVDLSELSTDDDGNTFKYRIVYVPIDDSNQGVFWGMFHDIRYKYGVSPTEYVTTSPTYSTDVLNSDIDITARIIVLSNDYVYNEFVSPEYCIGNRKQYGFVKLTDKCAKTDLLGGHHGDYQSNIYKIYDFSKTTAFDTLFEVDSQYDVEYSVDINGSIPLDSSDTFNRKGLTVVTLKNDVDGPAVGDDSMMFGNSNKGRCQILKTTVSAGSADLFDYSVVGCVYVDIFESQYGGLSYYSRKNNGYIPMTSFTDGASIEARGDSYAGVFEYLRQISDNSLPYIANNQDFPGDEHDMQTTGEYIAGGNEVLIFPTYSRYNLKLRSDDYLTKVYTQDGAYMIHEYAGVYTDYIAKDGTGTYAINENGAIFTQQTDLYLYNKTYSREEDVFKYYERQLNTALISNFNLRINASQNKIIGENSDSFMKQSGSYIDVDGKYGSIQNIMMFNDRLYFFQDDAIGIAATNERSQISDQNGNQISMGEIDLLSRFDYLTTNNGISNPDHILRTNYFIYAIDNYRKTILRISDKVEKISITNNVDSFVRSKYWNNGRIVWNRKYNEILFFYQDTDASAHMYALVFNERLQKFTGIYNFYYKMLSSVSIDRDDFYDELVINNNGYIMSLNDGDYNNFIGDFYPSEITYLIPSDNDNVVLFNVVEAVIRQLNESEELTNFMDSIRIYNSDYDTGELSFDDITEVKYKFGKYRTNRLRNYILGNNERILSNYVFVTIKTKDNDTALMDTDSNCRAFFRDLIVEFTEYNWFG